MKIRTRLLVFLLPPFVGSITLICSLLAFNWYKEIEDSFKIRLKSAVVSTAALIEVKARPFVTEHELKRICAELNITNLAFIPIESIPTSIDPSKLHLTPTCASPIGHGKQMTGYAPIIDEKGKLFGMITADISVDQIEKKFQDSLFLIIMSAILTILLMVATLIFIANKISSPIQELNNSALAIAAGQYGQSAEPSGPKKIPKEIRELANTLNTMSECLLENFNRLKENSLLRERMYGEYECSMLFQHLMLQKNIDDCHFDAITIKSITHFSDNPRGFLLDFPKTDSLTQFHIRLAEAEDTGFEGMYELLAQYKNTKDLQNHTSIHFDKSTSILKFNGPHTPLFWSLDQKQLLKVNHGKIKLECGDFFFLFNEGMELFFKDTKIIQDLLSKVLKVFAQDGLETTASMLQKEILFASKRKDPVDDLHLLCFQILSE
jgi:hypothetical protein